MPYIVMDKYEDEETACLAFSEVIMSRIKARKIKQSFKKAEKLPGYQVKIFKLTEVR